MKKKSSVFYKDLFKSIILIFTSEKDVPEVRKNILLKSFTLLERLSKNVKKKYIPKRNSFFGSKSKNFQKDIFENVRKNKVDFEKIFREVYFLLLERLFWK